MIELLQLAWEWRWAIFWVAIAIAAFWFLGWRGALAAAAAGMAHLFYRKGREDESAGRRERDREMEERLQDGYQDIDDRGADRDTVSDRLRDGKF